MEAADILDPASGLEADVDRALRPKTFADFTGQAKARANLEIFVKAARSRGESLDHVLFVGPPGLGKTTLAQIVAAEMGGGFKSTSGPAIAKAGELAAILTSLEDGDVLFIDEIHRLAPAVEEVLYPAMEDFKLDLIIGEGSSARSVTIELAKFTLVAATTRIGLLTKPLKDRFGIQTRLEFYTPEELRSIVERGARIMHVPLSSDGALEIARRSRGTPRIAGRLLRRVRDFADVAGCLLLDAEAADAALSKLDIDSMGLDNLDRRYLELMHEKYAGGPVGIETLSAALSEPRDALEDTVEPFLLQQGLIQRTSRGRVLARSAYEHLGLKLPPAMRAAIGPDLFAAQPA